MRKKYHVTQRDDGSWQGKATGAGRASVVAETKAEAVKETTGIAKGQGHSQVFIHGTNGRVQEERTYGGDPYPPKG